MDDVERAVDDGVNTFKVLTRVSKEKPNQNHSLKSCLKFFFCMYIIVTGVPTFQKCFFLAG